MIRINLLPVREARRQASLQKQAAMLGIAAFVGVLACAWLHFSVKSAQKEQQQLIAQAQTELKQLEATRKEVERFRKEKEDIERKLSVIAELERNRQGPVRIMDEIATRIPKRMWLTQLTLKEGALELKGISLDAEIVAAFLASLAESDLIHQVELDETRLEETDGLKLNSFKIHSRYGSATPASLPASPAKGQGRGRGR